ncbi:glycosyltransferase family 2 protein [Enterobacter hormaechei]|uniref:glycosyltransferase family 2 protein n=2 Tax=Enterobacter hormaechei TaxID=158836 RepID=UPI0007949C52|nr:glycosyltransferase [Enterobacter hormaechei]CZZ41937.1 capsular polysaccharide biosynthesis protein [Enterobacter hormaechei]SAA25354.1 capsular polysaccharide biosynthesis protein [Enterobacter hormaechei]SAA88710.1 capsular polysaccharide biosynthesis protein [Enterobacter hormaechei]SAG65407.1 capsular polysaccharide biosynthesis protein [Enterobacter hormaechei]
MSLPKLSVIIPCYNHERYVVTCLNTIQDSYQGQIEVIICDDKSRDNSLQLIKDFIKNATSKNISYVLLNHTANQGITKTLNECIAHATTDYIYIIASDDYLLKDGLTTAMNCLLNNSVDAVISDCAVVDDNDKLVHRSAFFDYRHSSLSKLRKNLAEELVFNWVVPGPALLQKKSVYTSLGGYNQDLMAEDRDYYLRMLATKKVIFNDINIACYRIHCNNASRSEEYLCNAKREFAAVNYSARNLYNGIARCYLKTYWFDLNSIPEFFVSKLRKFIKAIYLLRGSNG